MFVLPRTQFDLETDWADKQQQVQPQRPGPGQSLSGNGCPVNKVRGFGDMLLSRYQHAAGHSISHNYHNYYRPLYVEQKFYRLMNCSCNFLPYSYFVPVPAGGAPLVSI